MDEVEFEAGLRPLLRMDSAVFPKVGSEGGPAGHLTSSEAIIFFRCEALAMDSFCLAPVAPIGTRKLREEVGAGCGSTI